MDPLALRAMSRRDQRASLRDRARWPWDPLHQPRVRHPSGWRRVRVRIRESHPPQTRSTGRRGDLRSRGSGARAGALRGAAARGRRMTCHACGAENRDGARFCGECAAPLVKPVVCSGCGVTNPGGRKFCDACGASLVARPANDGVARKVVTIVFADLIGSTALHERLDPESVSRVMDHYHRAVRVPVEAHGGTVVQLLGDGVMCAFGVPRVAEDDAIRAVRAAVAIQQAFRDFAQEERAVVGDVGLRVAINTGEVVVTDDYAAGIGDPLNVAARLQQEARNGDVLVSESTRRLVGDLVTLEAFGVLSLRGRAETVAAYRVV